MSDKKPLNKPMPSDRPGKKRKVYVRDPDTGNVVTVHYGDTGYKHNYSAEAKKNFRARHNCSDKKDPTTPGYWACRDLWSTNKPPTNESGGRFSRIKKMIKK